MNECVPDGEEELFIREADSLISTFSTLGKASNQVATSKSSQEQRQTAKNHFNNFLSSPEVRGDSMLTQLPVKLDEIPVEDMADNNTLNLMLDGFGYYIANVGDSPYTPQTCQNYFSALKAIMTKIFDDNNRVDASRFFESNHVKTIRKGMAQACMVRLEAVSLYERNVTRIILP